MDDRPVTALTADEVLVACGTTTRGLDPDEAARRLRDVGANALPDPPRPSVLTSVVHQATHLMALLLWAAAALAIVAGLPELAIAIVAVVTINAIVSTIQELRAEHAMRALSAAFPRRARALRDGGIVDVDARDLVPGDLLQLEEGDAVSADARLVRTEGLYVDLAALTGESLPVERDAEPVTDERIRAIDATNLVLAGSTVTSGRGRAVVLQTGPRTELGRVALLTGSIERAPSTLELSVRKLVRRITWLALALGAATFAGASLIAGVRVDEALVFGIGIVVANVPEGLLPTVTVALALGVQRMARRNVLVRRLSSIETLGAVTTICTDKTGTLTTGQMELASLWVDGRFVDVARRAARDAAPDRAELLVALGCVCSNARLVGQPTQGGLRAVGDPTEGALLHAALALGFDPEVLREQSARVRSTPFDARRRRMAVIVRPASASPLTALAITEPLLLVVKGAANDVLARAASELGPAGRVPLGARERAVHERAHDELAARGERVLALAIRGLSSEDADGPADSLERDLTFVGLLGFHDPPRDDVAGAIERCRTAGITVHMVTGDHPLTALAVARRVGLVDDRDAELTHVVNGTELEALDDSELARLVGEKAPRIFARVLPEQKLRLVRAHQQLGRVVAVTGDGVNDAPALRAADIGIAMGRSGTDVAREAADVVLLDDHFASIVNGIEEGRAIHANVRKFLTYILASNVPQVVPYVAMVALHIPPALTIAQILAIDLGTDVAPALALGAEPPASDTMTRPPRARGAPLPDFGLLARAYLVLGTTEAIFSMSAFFAVLGAAGVGLGALRAVAPAVLGRTADPATMALLCEAQTAAFLAIVACQMGNLFACRSDPTHASRTFARPTRFILWALTAEVVLALALLVFSPVARALGLVGPPVATWWIIALGAPAVIVVSVVYDAVRRTPSALGVGTARGGTGKR